MRRSPQAGIGDAARAARAGRRSASRRSLPTQRGSPADRDVDPQVTRLTPAGVRPEGSEENGGLLVMLHVYPPKAALKAFGERYGYGFVW